MNREQELEIEVRRLEDEVASLKRKLTKIYGLASSGVVHTQRVGGRTGRPSGSTRFDGQVFVKDLFDTYERLPVDQRSRAEVAKALGLSRRTLHRYLERWDLAWPPVEVETLEDALARLARMHTTGSGKTGSMAKALSEGDQAEDRGSLDGVSPYVSSV